MRHFHEVAGRHQINVPLKTWLAMGYALEADQAEVEGVVGLICAIWAWHEANDWVTTEELARQLDLWRADYEALADLYNPTDQVLGVTGLIAAIYAWRELMLWELIVDIEGVATKSVRLLILS